jgi:hypothetical protein
MGDTQQLKQRSVNVKGVDHQAPSSEASDVSDRSPDLQHKSSMKPAKAWSFCSTPKVLIMLFGSLLGYMFIPILMVETTNLVELDFSSQSSTDYSTFQRSLRSLQEKPDAKTRIQHLMEDQYLLARQSLPTDRAPHVMETPALSDHRRKKILVTGGAGFVGSHLVDKLMMEGHEVTVLDNLFTGQKKNVAHWFHHPNFK